MAAVDDQMRRLGAPTSIHGGFAGTAKTFQQSLGNEPLLIAAALLTDRARRALRELCGREGTRLLVWLKIVANHLLV